MKETPAETRNRLLASHVKPNPDFDKWRLENIPVELWRNFDLTACRIGFEAAQEQFKVPVPELAGTFPVVLYFGSDADRVGAFDATIQLLEEFVVVRELLHAARSKDI